MISLSNTCIHDINVYIVYLISKNNSKWNLMNIYV